MAGNYADVEDSKIFVVLRSYRKISQTGVVEKTGTEPLLNLLWGTASDL